MSAGRSEEDMDRREEVVKRAVSDAPPALSELNATVELSPLCTGGQFFNLFNLGKSEQEMKTLKTKEIKNGRLAMLAVFGYGAQAVMTGEGPYKNLTDHLSNPFGGSVLRGSTPHCCPETARWAVSIVHRSFASYDAHNRFLITMLCFGCRPQHRHQLQPARGPVSGSIHQCWRRLLAGSFSQILTGCNCYGCIQHLLV